MANKSKIFNLAGIDLVVNRVITGKTKPSQGNVDISTSMANGAITDKVNVIRHTTGGTRTLTEAESGSLVIFDKADGIVVTLPVLSSTTAGMYFDFEILTTISSNAAKWSTGTQGTEFFVGSLVVQDSDGTVTSGAIFAGNGTTHDNISMNGSTTGGVAGTRFRLTAISSTLWLVSGYYVGSGAVATPFATT